MIPPGLRPPGLLAYLDAFQGWISPALNEKKPNPETITHACPQCSGPVACGKVNGCETCWCANLPRVMELPDDPDTKCLCENCLRLLIEKNQKIAD